MYARPLVVLFCYLVVYCTAEVSPTLFDTEESCRANCIGEHDSGCLKNPDGGQWLCRCQSMYYSRHEACKHECEENAYWSLFTTGECVPADPTMAGACQLTCAFRFRLWTTIFIIILFLSAAMLLIFMIPMCVSSFTACMMVKKQKKRSEEEAVTEMAHREVAQSKAMAQAAWSYPYAYWPYYNNMRG